AANVVATIDVPAIHHGRLRPEAKYAASPAPARPFSARPIASDSAKYAAMIAQSAADSAIGATEPWPVSTTRALRASAQSAPRGSPDHPLHEPAVLVVADRHHLDEAVLAEQRGEAFDDRGHGVAEVV